MIQITPHMRILVAIDRVDGRKGIDWVAQLCREKLAEDPFSGCLFLFLNQSGTTLKGLCYDGSGYWMCQKRLSKGRFPWPKDPRKSQPLEFHSCRAEPAGFADMGFPPAQSYSGRGRFPGTKRSARWIA